MRRTTLAGTILTTALVLGSLVGPTAGSAPRQDPRAERERVRAEQAEVARRIDASEATVAEVDEAIAALDRNLAAEEAALAAVEEELAQAERDIADAEASIARLEEDVVGLREAVRQRAVDAYVSPPGDDVLTVLDSQDFTSASARKFYVELRASSDADVADRLGGALADLDDARQAATEAKDVAEAKQAEQAERTDAVRQARDDKQAVADSIQATIDANVARSVELAETDRKLAAEILEQQAALNARLVRERAAQLLAERKAADQRTPASSQAPNGSENVPLPPPPPAGGPSVGSTGIRICYVGSIDINCELAPKLQGLVDAAAADGIALSGGGYRDPAEQVALRQQNCGSSPYAIYEMPSGSCSPPTAKPGTSQHELGMAVDFSYQGRTLCFKRATCRPGENRAYDWLVAHAAEHDFYKLRSEAWHWSPTGR